MMREPKNRMVPESGCGCRRSAGINVALSRQAAGHQKGWSQFGRCGREKGGASPAPNSCSLCQPISETPLFLARERW